MSDTEEISGTEEMSEAGSDYSDDAPSDDSANGDDDSADWDIDLPLLSFSTSDVWTIRDSFEGALVLGGIGSGKSSGSGYTLRRTFLRHWYGGLVTAAKPSEPEIWIRDCAMAGRNADVIRFSPESNCCFNMFDYELTRVGRGSGYTRNLVAIIGSAFDASGPDTGRNGSSDEHWREARDYLLGHAIDLCFLATGTVSIPALLEIVRSAPTTLAMFDSPKWRARSPFFAKLVEAKRNARSSEEFATFRNTVDYFREFASWEERYRGSVVAMFTTSADPLIRPPFNRLFSGASNVTPQDTFDGKIIILDLPVSQFGAVGRSAQALFKTAWQMEVLRRSGLTETRPVFLYADEAQNFISSFDAVFQNEAREARAATVFLTQNISNVLSAMRGRGGDDAAKSLIANLQTKIFHANGHFETNSWAEQLIGKELRVFHSGSASDASPFPTESQSANLQFAPKVSAHEFTTLRTGGPSNGGLIDAVVFQAGRPWQKSETNHLRITYKQAPRSR